MVWLNFSQIKLRKEMVNMSKRQPPDHKANNSRRQPMGLNVARIPAPVGVLQLAPKICIIVQ